MGGKEADGGLRRPQERPQELLSWLASPRTGSPRLSTALLQALTSIEGLCNPGFHLRALLLPHLGTAAASLGQPHPTMAAAPGSHSHAGYCPLPGNEPAGLVAASEPPGRRRSTLRPLSLPPGLHLSGASGEHATIHISTDHEAAVAQRLLWHAQHQAPACLASLQASSEGLTEREAAERLRKHGPNVLAARGPAAWYRQGAGKP